MTTDLALRSTVRAMVAAFELSEREVRTAFAAIVLAEQRINDAFSGGTPRDIRIDASGYGYHDNFEDPDLCMTRVSREAWARIVQRLELRRMMSLKRYAELEKQLADGVLPQITEANVIAFVEGYASDIPVMALEAVTEVFEWLRPHHSRHKTNTELEIGAKVVLTGIVERAYAAGKFEVKFHRQQNLVALGNVFSMLDGRGAIAKTYAGPLRDAIETSTTGHADTPYFRVKMFNNGNLHLEFKRLDLLAKLNQMAGGKNLRPTREDDQ